MAKKKKVSLIGSGNWGTVICKILGNNILCNEHLYEKNLPMFVKKELYNGIDLCDIINEKKMNKKYMPHCFIPDNVMASSDLLEVTDRADILVFVLPHQYVREICETLKGHVKNDAIAISLIKGFDVYGNKLDLISNVIRSQLNIPCSVLMGANLAYEVALEMYSEATIGCKDEEVGILMKKLFQTHYFRIVVVDDELTVELGGALKNIVAMGAGFSDGLNGGHNTKSAVIRLGLMEMMSFSKMFFKDSKMSTYFESSGLGDLVTTCYAGRNHRVAKEFASNPQQTLENLEMNLLNGQKLQGPLTAAEVACVLKLHNVEGRFPMFSTIHKICSGEMPVSSFMDCLKNHPEHL
ncbi:hypothetical protein HELRODRAFT_187732 [Helobdella robusta]|uniref:Glycerol-3-phosphate dehydrogenase [NAD(+)] n=1 Tax=Helobdella robusta TaxID=6412 RepID=T1FPC3_HELRO|nr:hypothetical protein HELRODRAFT_187732 [Helobdella robusta]ESO09743.1 hypothetical protein HELRODRAFT_187732 [Helobdella robusta]